MKKYMKPALVAVAPLSEYMAALSGNDIQGNGTQLTKDRNGKDVDDDNVANGWVDGLW